MTGCLLYHGDASVGSPEAQLHLRRLVKVSNLQATEISHAHCSGWTLSMATHCGVPLRLISMSTTVHRSRLLKGRRGACTIGASSSAFFGRDLEMTRFWMRCSSDTVSICTR